MIEEIKKGTDLGFSENLLQQYRIESTVSR